MLEVLSDFFMNSMSYLMMMMTMIKVELIKVDFWFNILFFLLVCVCSLLS